MNISTMMKKITPREHEVLQLIAQGRTQKYIAEELYISVETVKTHRRNLLDRLEAFNGPHLVAKAFGLGILAPERRSEHKKMLIS